LLTYFRCIDGKIERRDAFTKELFEEFPRALHWIDLDTPTPEEGHILEDPFHFHPLAIEDCLKDVNHPKVDDYDGYIFFIVHGVRFDAPKDVFETRELDIFLGPNYLITHHEGPMRSIETAQEQCGKAQNPAMPRGVDFLAHQILDHLFDHYFPNLDALEDRIDEVQAEVFSDPQPSTLQAIFRLRKDVMQLRRISQPQRDLVNRLARGEFKEISARAAVYFRDIYDNLYRLVDASYQYHDLVQGTLEAYLSVVNNRLNEAMKRLTVVTAILAPVTVISGVYGMNFEHMPELHWRFGYAWAIVLMLLASGGLVGYFRKRGWI
jgi:magnesium transporter